MENIKLTPTAGYPVSGSLCMTAGVAAQWHESAVIQERGRKSIQLPVLVSADVPNNNTTALSAHRVRRT